MLDFNHVLSTPGADVQYFENPQQTNLLQWQTWRKPRGAKFIYMLGVGAGASGASGINTGVSSGGGAGGTSGAQTIVMIPAMLVPDVLYVQCGIGGTGVATSGSLGNAGTNTYVAIGPTNGTAIAVTDTILYAPGGAVATAQPTASLGGTSAAGAGQVIGNMPLAARGFFFPTASGAGFAGGSSTAAGTLITFPQLGSLVCGGAGGGGSGTTGGAGGAIIFTIAGSNGTEFAVSAQPGGIAAVTSTPAGRGVDGTKSRYAMFYYGGTGGGGSTNTAGGIGGAGGNGAPGCGGGGGGGATTTNTTIAPGGNGGGGFVYIITT